MTRMRSLCSILLVGAVLGFPLLSRADQAEAQKTKTPTVGDKAPDISLKDFHGKRFTLSDLKGHEGALLWFTNLCEGCQSKFGEMEKYRSEYSGEGFEVILVRTDQIAAPEPLRQAVVEELLRQEPLERVRVREVMGRARTEGLTDEGGWTVRTWPDQHGMDGFFVSVLRRRPG